MQEAITAGSLLYLADGLSRAVNLKTVDLKGILHLRNDLAAFLSRQSHMDLPGNLGSFFQMFVLTKSVECSVCLQFCIRKCVKFCW